MILREIRGAFEGHSCLSKDEGPVLEHHEPGAGRKKQVSRTEMVIHQPWVGVGGGQRTDADSFTFRICFK